MSTILQQPNALETFSLGYGAVQNMVWIKVFDLKFDQIKKKKTKVTEAKGILYF